MFKKLLNAFKNLLRVTLKMFWFLLISSLIVIATARIVTGVYANGKTYTETNVPSLRVAIVFGAGLTRSGEATPVLKDRVETAARLYFAGKVEKLLMSGDNRFVEYNEPEAMRQYALSLGVPDKDIVLDYAGRRTYDTCYRAKAIFQVKQAILVTQPFHMPRALFLCNMLGVDGVGVNANNRVYLRRSLAFWNMRELPATVTAFADLITRPLPVLGNPEPIFPESAQ